MLFQRAGPAVVTAHPEAAWPMCSQRRPGHVRGQGMHRRWRCRPCPTGAGRTMESAQGMGHPPTRGGSTRTAVLVEGGALSREALECAECAECGIAGTFGRPRCCRSGMRPQSRAFSHYLREPELISNDLATAGQTPPIWARKSLATTPLQKILRVAQQTGCPPSSPVHRPTQLHATSAAAPASASCRWSHGSKGIPLRRNDNGHHRPRPGPGTSRYQELITGSRRNRCEICKAGDGISAPRSTPRRSGQPSINPVHA